MHKSIYVYVSKFMFTYKAIKCLSNQLKLNGPILYMSIIYITILTNIQKNTAVKNCIYAHDKKYVNISFLVHFICLKYPSKVIVTLAK